MEKNGLMPCGKKDCSGCDKCKYDMSLDTPLKKLRLNKMKNFGLVPVDGNPSTAQLIIPGLNNRHMPPVNTGCTQLALPFKPTIISAKDCLYCNGCEHFIKIERPNKNSFNTRCGAEEPKMGNSYRVIKLSVYPDEKVKKPFWCPILNNKITKNIENSLKKDPYVFDDENRRNKEREEEKRKEKWLGINGLTSWSEIKINTKYHLPPTPRRKRTDFTVRIKYINSIHCVEEKTNNTFWLYKDDEDYKFISIVK
jgi:hypothetical protein